MKKGEMKGSNAVDTAKLVHISGLVDAASRVTAFEKACRNDSPFKNQTKASLLLNRRRKRCKKRGSLSEYVSRDNDGRRTYHICSVSCFCSNRSPFQGTYVVSCSAVLGWLSSFSPAATALIGAPGPASIQCRTSFKVKDRK